MMIRKTLDERVEELALRYERVSPQRDRRLFTEFLVDGYKMTTLPGVLNYYQDKVVYGKVCLGMIITLFDDLADNPACINPRLLKKLYLLNLKELPPLPMDLSHEEINIYQLAVFLFTELEESLSRLPHFTKMVDILIFDLRQIFLANQYAELMTSIPEIRNLRECQAHGPYNMGMVAAGMIDLMASPAFQMTELGKVREIFIEGQRLGRIGNLINTYEREKREGDLTNEMLLYSGGIDKSKKKLLEELAQGLTKITAHEGSVKSVTMGGYGQSLSDLYDLHTLMKGII